eukprot:PhM_4_TR15302/c0_g1_i1/m.37854
MAGLVSPRTIAIVIGLIVVLFFASTAMQAERDPRVVAHQHGYLAPAPVADTGDAHHHQEVVVERRHDPRPAVSHSKIGLLDPAPRLVVRGEDVQHAAPSNVARARPPPLSVANENVRGYEGSPDVYLTPPPACKYVFKRYEPSPWEARWARNISYYEKNVCKSLLGEDKPLVDIYVQNLPKCTINSLATDGKPLRSYCPEPQAPEPFDERVFSKYHYQLECDSAAALEASGLPVHQVSYIEPLAGMLRHPQICEKQEWDTVINKNYMVVDEWTMKRNKKLNFKAGRHPRNFYFDAGASVWDDGPGGA